MLSKQEDFEERAAGRLRIREQGAHKTNYIDPNGQVVGDDIRMPNAGVDKAALQDASRRVQEIMHRLFKNSSFATRHLQLEPPVTFPEVYDSTADILNDPRVYIRCRGKPIGLNEAAQVAKILSVVLEKQITPSFTQESQWTSVHLNNISLNDILNLTQSQIVRGAQTATVFAGPVGNPIYR